MAKLSDAQITAQLHGLPGWQRVGHAITRQYTFPSFLKAIEFINAIAPLAEAANHHPDIANTYNRITITLSTHDEGGITDKDTALATQIEKAAGSLPS